MGRTPLDGQKGFLTPPTAGPAPPAMFRGGGKVTMNSVGDDYE